MHRIDELLWILFEVVYFTWTISRTHISHVYLLSHIRQMFTTQQRKFCFGIMSSPRDA